MKIKPRVAACTRYLFYWVSGDIKINATIKLADWMYTKQSREGRGADSMVLELRVPIPLKKSRYQTRIGEGCRNGGAPREQVQPLN